MTTTDLHAEREQVFRNFVLIIQKADPHHVHFYTNSVGAEDRIYDGNIRENTQAYKISYAPVVHLGKLHGSLAADAQPLLIAIAAHQTRRDSPFCRYSPQIFAFLATCFSFRRAMDTVLEYLKLDELGWYTLHAVSDVIAHDHPLATDRDLDELTNKLLEKLKSLENDKYEQQKRIPYHEGGFGSGHVEYWRAKNTAGKVLKQLREVRHMRLVRGLSDNPVPRGAISTSTFKTGDATLNALLEAAQSKFLSDKPEVRKEALEKLWDAWERLKTLEPGKDKKASTTALLDKVAKEPSFRQTLENEAAELTLVGNSYMIRHTEIGKIPITSQEQADYLFHRMFSLVRLILRSTGRGG